MGQFKTNPWKLGDLLTQLDKGKVVLPEFQRSFVWKAPDIDLLLTSLIQDYPAGSLLFLRSDPSGQLAWRVVEGIDVTPDGLPDYLVLDGQQRLTSLSLAINGRGDHLFFIDLALLADGDLENAVYPMRRVEARRKGLLDVEKQWELHTYPVTAALGVGANSFWFQDYVEFHVARGADRDDLRTHVKQLQQRFIHPLSEYQFPVVELPAETELEAVCQIFETLNRTGVRLTVFDLLTARFWPLGLDLRALSQNAIEEFPLIGPDEFDVESTFLLQAVSLLRSGLCKRGDLLVLQRDGFEADWRRVCRGASAALSVLRSDCGVLTKQWLPYAAGFPSLFAAAARIEELSGPQVGQAWDKVKRWFWCSAFGQRYDGPVNTTNAADLRQMLAWLEDDSRLPDAVSGFQIEDVGLGRTERQRSAVYRAVVCLTVVNGARDFHTGNRLTSDYLKDPRRRIEDHHLFPSGYLKRLSPPKKGENTILNRALIDHDTNRIISAKAPSVYLAEIEDQLGHDRFEEVLASHLIPYSGVGALQSDDTELFLAARERLLIGAIAGVTGAAVPSLSTGEAYLDPTRPFSNELALRKVLRGLRGDVLWYEQHLPRKALELLVEEVLTDQIRGIRLLSGPSNIDERAKRDFAHFSEEMSNGGVDCEWRVLPSDEARQFHARVIFDDEQAWELPPLNSLLMGTVDSIRVSGVARDRFEGLWASLSATPLPSG